MRRREAAPPTSADVTYGTNTEYRLRLPARQHGHAAESRRVQRGHLHYAIVDEVDSILIDEARTPLIISGAWTIDPREMYTQVQTESCSGLIAEDDYRPWTRQMKAINADGRRGLRKARAGVPGWTTFTPTRQARLAQPPYQPGIEGRMCCSSATWTMLCRTGEVIIVDEFTGRTDGWAAAGTARACTRRLRPKKA